MILSWLSSLCSAAHHPAQQHSSGRGAAPPASPSGHSCRLSTGGRPLYLLQATARPSCSSPAWQQLTVLFFGLRLPSLHMNTPEFLLRPFQGTLSPGLFPVALAALSQERTTGLRTGGLQRRIQTQSLAAQWPPGALLCRMEVKWDGGAKWNNGNQAASGTRKTACT